MTRKDAESTINDLFGLEHESAQGIISEMGPRALSDEAVIAIARAQLDIERRKGEEIDRVDRYQKSHPGLSWRECEQDIRLGLR